MSHTGVAGFLLGCATVLAIVASGSVSASETTKADRPNAIDPARYGGRKPDAAFGAFQRGLYITALNLARPRAEAGDPAAQTLMAEIHARGLGVPRDEATANKWYARAAEQGVAEAQFRYAMAIVDEKVAGKDENAALRMLKLAADRGHRLAQFNFAQLTLQRKPGAEGMALAVGYYESAAKAGLADAQYAMARVYGAGVGGRSHDPKRARRWLEMAARQNFDTAQLDLATWLVEGRGGERNLEAGFAWMKIAAESGNVAAQNRLAKLYRGGLGVEADPVAAAAWYIIARRAGLSDPEMNVFLDGLTIEQQQRAIETANRLRR